MAQEAGAVVANNVSRASFFSFGESSGSGPAIAITSPLIIYCGSVENNEEPLLCAVGEVSTISSAKALANSDRDDEPLPPLE